MEYDGGGVQDYFDDARLLTKASLSCVDWRVMRFCSVGQICEIEGRREPSLLKRSAIRLSLGCREWIHKQP